ncbi:MAG: 2-oxoisovalerate dehydrogenase [Oscillospiraceae bacterium]|nr:2-oxoisovalerate dehydrogenase [Oscillospiraceae bacterium]
MNTEVIFIVTESLDGGYEAKALGHSIYTQCDGYEELAETLKDAVLCHFDKGCMPSVIRMHFVKDEVIAV